MLVTPLLILKPQQRKEAYMTKIKITYSKKWKIDL